MGAATTRGAVMRWLVHGHFWLAMAVAAQIGYTGLFLKPGTPIVRYAIAACLGAIAIYGMIRFARSRSASEEGLGTLGWFRAHKKTMLPLVLVAGLSSLLLVGPLLPSVWPWLLPALVLALLYVTPFDLAKGHAVGLRAVPFLKAVLIAALWAVVTVAVPWRLDQQEHGTFTILSMACMRVPLFMGLAIIFDIRDLRQDAPGLRTVPLLFGVTGAKVIAILLLACSAAFETIFLRGLGQYPAAWSILVGYAVAMAIVFRARPGDHGPGFDLLVDGMMILIPVCAWIGMQF